MWITVIYKHILPYIVCIICYSPVQSQVVAVKVSEYPLPGTVTEDTVYYSSSRKLDWNDFKGRIRDSSPSIANTYTGFRYNATAFKKNDSISVHLILQIYFDRRGSWVRQNLKSDYALSHEQLHFDIAKLIADQFRDTLLRSQFSPDYYDSEIYLLFWDYWRKMTDMEQQFDAETNHGINRNSETRWQEKIRKQLLLNSGPDSLPDE